jgi:Na+-driven multidrug efflux pump
MKILVCPYIFLHHKPSSFSTHSLSIEVVALVASIMPLMGIFQVFDGISAVTAGVLRARGKQVRSVFAFGFGFDASILSYFYLLPHHSSWARY